MISGRHEHQMTDLKIESIFWIQEQTELRSVVLMDEEKKLKSPVTLELGQYKLRECELGFYDEAGQLVRTWPLEFDE